MADDEPHRVCCCGRRAFEDGDRVSCPLHGPIQRWDVTLAGRILYPAPRKRAHRRTRHVTV